MSKLNQVYDLLKNLLTNKDYYGEFVIVIRAGEIHSVTKKQSCLLAPKEKPEPNKYNDPVNG